MNEGEARAGATNGGIVLEFRLLGAFEVLVGGRALVLPGNRPRALLAALVLRPNCLLGVGDLAEAVWEVPPSAPESNIRTYVAGLRRLLREAGEDETRLVTGPGGYRLRVEPGESDTDVFRDLADRGEQAWRRADFAATAHHLGAALALWRGRPLPGLPVGRVLEADFAELGDLRLKIAVRHAQAQLELGRGAVIVPGLRTLVAEHPLREEVWAQLMMALHQSGRRAEALECFTRARAHLVAELGVEPGARLQRAQREILAQEAPAEPGARHQLPMDIAEFTGRDAELRELLEPARSGTAVPIFAITGMAGVGKTRLAVHAAHQLVAQGKFDEIQLWADLRGFDPAHPPADPAEVLATFLRLLGVAGQHMPHDLDSRAALYRDRLAGRRAVVLLDNAASETQISPLLPGTPGCLVLVTSKRELSTMDGLRSMRLGVMRVVEAVALLARITGDDRVNAEPVAAARVAELCGRLPIALSHAARRLRARPMWTVADLAGHLAREQAGPDKAVFDMSYRALSPEQQRVFRLLGGHPGADMTAESAAALTGTTAGPVLEMLLDEHMLVQTTAGRYRFHDLMRRYSCDRAAEDEPAETGREASHRLFAWFLHAAESARGRIDPNRARIFGFHPLPAGCVVPGLTGYDEAMAWLDAERATLRAVVGAAAGHGFPDIAWQLAWVLLSYYYRSSHWDDWVQTYRFGLEATQSMGDRRAEGIMWRGLGVAHSDLRQYPVAIDCHQRAQALLEAAGDRHGQAWNLNNLGVIHVDLGDHVAAARCFGRALPLFRETADLHGEGICLNNLGDTCRLLGRPSRALEHLGRALAIQENLADKASLQFTLRCLGDLHHDAGRYEEALTSYGDAVTTSRALGDRRTVARSLADMGRTLDLLGEPAENHWRQALEIFEEIGDVQADAVRARLGVSV